MITTFTFPTPPHTVITQSAVDPWIGTRVPLCRDGVVIGEAHILDAIAGVTGVKITYETDTNFGISLDL